MSIRYHNGEFYIYCGDPDRGIFMVKIDPSPYWYYIDAAAKEMFLTLQPLSGIVWTERNGFR